MFGRQERICSAQKNNCFPHSAYAEIEFIPNIILQMVWEILQNCYLTGEAEVLLFSKKTDTLPEYLPYPTRAHTQFQWK